MGKLTLTPAIGVLDDDENFNEYYYGISGNESRRSGLSSYSPGDSWTPYVGLSAKYALTSNLRCWPAPTIVRCQMILKIARWLTVMTALPLCPV